ncbi:MAG: hypothetical protein L0220_22205, partial [Acidobacteria bacterium]|nr:hypothetical protein [Acidobacteriota bacterium]
IAQKYWETRFTKCGDSWYGDYLTIYLNEYKNGIVWVEATRLTAADKLNGYEWKGETGMNATAYRQYRGTWQEWHPSTQFYSPLKSMGTTISKKNGRWFFENVEADSFTARPKKLSCDQIPR